MIFASCLILWCITLTRFIGAVNAISVNEIGDRDFLRNLNDKAAEIASELANVQWEFETNQTDYVKKELVRITSKAIENAKQSFHKVVDNYPWKSYSNPDIRQQLKLFSEIGTLALPEKEYNEFQKIISDLDVIQENTTICDFYSRRKCDLHFSDVQEKLESSQNVDELSYLWSEWRKATQPEFTKLLNNYVKLCNQAASLNNYANFQEYSLRNIEGQNVKEEMTSLWEDMKPLYSQIHAYVRRRLRNIYGEKIVPLKGPIPAHLLGNIWSENWFGIAQRMVPFPEQDNFNFTEAMLNQGFTPESVRRWAEDFLRSMNFSVCPHLWLNSSDMPLHKNIENCHPKIFNFYAGGVRIKACEKVTFKEYLEDIRLLTKVEYMLQYKSQPFVYQTPVDPGLEEAVNDVMTMSASSFDNLKNHGLFKGEITEEIRLNELFKLALEKVMSVPFLLVQEFWRWDVYSGKTVEETMATASKLREKFQGISSSSEEVTFAPGGIGSAFSKLSLTHHFLGIFLEFQMHESLCQMSASPQQETPINECNLYHNVEAGEALRKLMSLGSSKTLTEAFSSILGLNRVNSKSLLTYFESLMKWLAKENEIAGEFVGWEESDHSKEKKPFSSTRRKRSLGDYSTEMKDDDSCSSSSGESDRFQRVVFKRSKNSEEIAKVDEKEERNAENDKFEKLSNSLFVKRKQKRNVGQGNKRLFYLKNRRSLMKSNDDLGFNDMITKKELSDSFQPVTKRHLGFEAVSKPSYNQLKSLPNKRESTKRKGSDLPLPLDPISGNTFSNFNARARYSKGKTRFTRMAQKQRRNDREVTFPQSNSIYSKNENYQNQNEAFSSNAQWQPATERDLPSLIQSIGVALENDDKDTIKNLRENLEGDSSADLKSNIASKDSSYENMFDYNRVKTGESSPSLEKKDSFSSSHLTSSLLGHMPEEKVIRKKEISPSNEPSLTSGKEAISESRQNSESAFRHMNIDMPSLQALLQKSDMNPYGQKQILMLTPDASDNKFRYEPMNQFYGAKANPNKYVSSYAYKYAPTSEGLQFKEKKEFKDGEGNVGGKSSYIIIVGKLAPEVREKLQGVNYVAKDTNQALLQSGSNSLKENLSGKRSRASEQIYGVPIDVKYSQQSLIKTNHYTEHEHEAGHDPNTERDQESEEVQLHLEDNSKLEDKSNYYKTGKESPSEFIISWNSDKSRKIVKRSKREHRKEVSDDKMKVVRVTPMKDSFLEGLLTKSIVKSKLGNKSLKTLMRDALLNGNSDLSALTAASSPSGNMAVSVPVMDSQGASLQQSSLSSLASSVFSALSPKNLGQISKSSSQRQDSELEEENLKDSGNLQPLVGKKKGAKLHAEDETKGLIEVDPAAKGDDACCKKIILTSCPRCPCPCPGPCPPCPGPCPCPLPCPCPCPPPCPLPCPCPCPCPCPSPCPCPCPEDCCKRIIECPPVCCKPECDLCCKKPSECSLVNCQFKITKAKKPHERLTIMIYDRINPPAELPEPYDALAVISEILQRIQCCPCKPCCQLTEEDPDYPANDNTDQLKGIANQAQDNKGKVQELSGEMPVIGNDASEEDETDANMQVQNAPSSAEEDKYQHKDKATPAIDQLTVFNKDKLKPVLIELRKIDDIIKKRSQKE